MESAAVDHIDIINCLTDDCRDTPRNEILKGITAPEKYVPSKYFYDDYGSYLFELICGLPEYYQTRTELSLLRDSAQSIMSVFPGGQLIELGSGANWKVRTLLDAAWSSSRPEICYVPFDVSEMALKEASRDLPCIYPGLRVTGIVGDFTRHMSRVPAEGSNRLFLFFGSTIGNFDEQERVCLLGRVAQMMGPDDRFIVGIDMVKSKFVLERAYNDSRGVTAEFNKNILNAVNRELGISLDKSHFDHLAFFDDRKERVEMHLKANRNISAEIDGCGAEITMRKGETIRTEICTKFTKASAWQMASEAGLNIKRWFTDSEGYFSLIELSRLS